jgi:hypothetical protein
MMSIYQFYNQIASFSTHQNRNLAAEVNLTPTFTEVPQVQPFGRSRTFPRQTPPPIQNDEENKRGVDIAIIDG